tara:strand:+ start:1104 stop:1517 length:414 start_codon:yes stop_codon:yes gene_type:complete
MSQPGHATDAERSPSDEYMMSVQMQRVHEEHGREDTMATVSRRLLLLAAVLLLIAGIGLKIASGGSTLLVIASGLGLIFVILAWSLFDDSSTSSLTKGATPIKASYSSGTSFDKLSTERQEQTLPDPVESGFEIPLM